MSKPRANGQRDLTGYLSYLRDATSWIFALLGQGLSLSNIRLQRNTVFDPKPAAIDSLPQSHRAAMRWICPRFNLVFGVKNKVVCTAYGLPVRKGGGQHVPRQFGFRAMIRSSARRIASSDRLSRKLWWYR